MMFSNYPPGPMTGRGGPHDEGCPCANCPVQSGGTCTCDLEALDDEGEGGLPDLICNYCGACREHCHCYDGDGNDAAEVEEGDVLDAFTPNRESGLEWDTGAESVPAANGQKFTVFQRLELPPGAFYTRPPAQVRRSDYQRVAEVQAAALEMVFALTQHLEVPWWEHPGVTLVHESQEARSTSVGDVIADAAGQPWMVQTVGFCPVTWEPEPSPVIEFTIRLRIDDQPAFWRWALGLWRSQWGPRETLPESARSLSGIALEAFVLSNPTWGSELAIEFEDYSHHVLEGHPFAYPDVLTIELPDE